MEDCRRGKKPKLFLLGSDVTDQVFTREFSRMDSTGVLICLKSTLFRIAETLRCELVVTLGFEAEDEKDSFFELWQKGRCIQFC